MNSIYKPSGAAKEYVEYALNIYTGCQHRCFYCFASGTDITEYIQLKKQNIEREKCK